MEKPQFLFIKGKVIKYSLAKIDYKYLKNIMDKIKETIQKKKK
jgi:hypothetical protein